MENITDTLYDLSILKELDGDEYASQVIGIFLEQAPMEIKEMKKSLAAKDTFGLCKAAHKLKGSAIVLQADKLAELLDCIEATAKAGETGKVLELLLENAQQLYVIIEKQLRLEMI